MLLKLSKLQRWILRAALDPELVLVDQAAVERRREKELRELIHSGKRAEAKLLGAIHRDDRWRPGRFGVVRQHQIKEAYFRLPRAHNSGGWAFAKNATPGYKAVSNSASRAANRLKQRGLVRLGYAGEIAPTLEGYAAAAAIELQTPGANGFDPIPRQYLERIIEEAQRMPNKQRSSLNGGYPHRAEQNQ